MTNETLYPGLYDHAQSGTQPGSEFTGVLRARSSSVSQFPGIGTQHQIYIKCNPWSHPVLSQNHDDKGLAANSVKRAVSSIRTYHNFLSAEGLMVDNPAQLLDAPKIPQKLPNILTIQEVDDILGVIPEKAPMAKRDLAIFEMMYSCGLRVTELCDFKTTDILWDSEMIRVNGKGDKQRFVPIGPIARENLRNYLNHERPALTDKNPNVAEVFLSRNGRKLTRMMIWILLKILLFLRKEDRLMQ